MASLQGLITVAKRLEQAEIRVALGGSGLLNALELSYGVRDWDLTTDHPIAPVLDALDDLEVERKSQTDLYASDYLLWIPSCEVEIMGRYRMRSNLGLCHFPVYQSGVWNGVPLASGEVWAIAYEMMGRPAKAQLLFEYIRTTGVHSDVLTKMLEQPLPTQVRRKVITELNMGQG